ncbi:MAG: ubiquinone/menaquinone biosynthesis methyltransferase [Vicinamibacterales bacterium]
MALRDEIATPERKRAYVRALFGTIADRYDLITRLLSYGRDQRWKARVLDIASPGPTTRVLDLATGTGDLAFAAATRTPHVVGLDITPGMITLARKRQAADSPPRFLVGDMCALPFPNASFDLVLTGYGLRNVPDLPGAIDEMARVLVADGVAVSLDFDRPSHPMTRAAYLAYLHGVGGLLGWALHGDPDTYRYIPASIRRYPGAAALTQMMEARGFRTVRHFRVLGGLMAIHRAVR